MNFSKILSDLGGNSGGRSSGKSGGGLQNISSKIPGGLAGGAIAGGIVATLLGSKSVRKTAGKAATYGGAAMLGGLAYKAYKSWQQGNSSSPLQAAAGRETYAGGYSAELPGYEQEALAHTNGVERPPGFQLVLIKAMIASARADGTIDSQEQGKISAAIDQLELNPAAKGELLELFIKPIAITDFTSDLHSIEQKAEIYLASCLAIELDHEREYAHLSNLSRALGLPAGLEQELRNKAADSLNERV